MADVKKRAGVILIQLFCTVYSHIGITEPYLEMACEADRTLVGAAKLNQISLMVSFMLLESGGGGMRGRSFFRSSDSTPSSCRAEVKRI